VDDNFVKPEDNDKNREHGGKRLTGDIALHAQELVD